MLQYGKISIDLSAPFFRQLVDLLMLAEDKIALNSCTDRSIDPIWSFMLNINS
jgi:hypothetical protein